MAQDGGEIVGHARVGTVHDQVGTERCGRPAAFIGGALQAREEIVTRPGDDCEPRAAGPQLRRERRGGFREREGLRTLLSPAAVRERLRNLASEPPAEGPDGPAGASAEIYEAARRDEDRL